MPFRFIENTTRSLRGDQTDSSTYGMGQTRKGYASFTNIPHQYQGTLCLFVCEFVVGEIIFKSSPMTKRADNATKYAQNPIIVHVFNVF